MFMLNSKIGLIARFKKNITELIFRLKREHDYFKKTLVGSLLKGSPRPQRFIRNGKSALASVLTCVGVKIHKCGGKLALISVRSEVEFHLISYIVFVFAR